MHLLLLFQPRVETKPEAQSQPPRVREQRPRERPGFPPRGPRPGEVHQLLLGMGTGGDWLTVTCLLLSPARDVGVCWGSETMHHFQASALEKWLLTARP